MPKSSSATSNPARNCASPIGDSGASAPAPDAGGPPTPAGPPIGATGALAISGDSRWAAFQAWPSTKDAKKLKKDRKPIQTKVVLVELATGKKTLSSRRRGASSSPAKNPARSLSIAIPPTLPPVRLAAAAAGPGAGPAADRPTGTDLLLYELASASELNLGNVSEFAFDKKGDWMAALIDARDKAGNGVVLRNMSTGALQSLDSAVAVYKGLTWTDKGDALAALRGVEDKGFEEKLYSVVAFKGFNAGAAPAKSIYDPKADKSFPAGMTIAATRNAAWRDDLSAVTFGIHEVKAKKAPPARGDADPQITVASPLAADTPGEDKPDLVLWHWKDSRLQTQQAVQETIDKNFSYLSVWRPGDGKFVRLADDSVRAVTFRRIAKSRSAWTSANTS